MDQCKLADELHITWSDSEKMSVVDRRYALEYLEAKTKAINDMFKNNKKK